MKRFEAIILSETEPVHTSLWLRPDKDKHGMTIWWYSPQGWKQLFDADTRYNVTNDFDYSPAEDTISTSGSTDTKNGITSVSNTYYVYDASRKIGDNANLVTEKGLNFHVEDLQGKIDTLETNLEDLSERVNANKDSIENLSDEVSSIKEEMSSIKESLETLKEGMSTFTDIITNIENRLSALEPTA